MDCFANLKNLKQLHSGIFVSFWTQSKWNLSKYGPCFSYSKCFYFIYCCSDIHSQKHLCKNRYNRCSRNICYGSFKYNLFMHQVVLRLHQRANELNQVVYYDTEKSEPLELIQEMETALWLAFVCWSQSLSQNLLSLIELKSSSYKWNLHLPSATSKVSGVCPSWLPSSWT